MFNTSLEIMFICGLIDSRISITTLPSWESLFEDSSQSARKKERASVSFYNSTFVDICINN